MERGENFVEIDLGGHPGVHDVRYGYRYCAILQSNANWYCLRHDEELPESQQATNAA